MDESYTSLPTSHLLGSVPAVVPDEKIGTGASSSGTTETNSNPYPPNLGAKDATFQSIEEQIPNRWNGIFSVSSYAPYFNVDTDVVINRIAGAFYPTGGNFMSKIDANPDLYGLIWISTTLIFALSAMGNLATYFIQKSSNTWSFDVGYVSVAFWFVYGYAVLVPLAFYFLLKYFNCNANLIQFWCLWGYSLFVFIPASVLLLIPVEFVRWFLILAVGADSACFVTANLMPVIEGSELSMIMAASFCLQFAFAIFVKVWFFS